MATNKAYTAEQLKFAKAYYRHHNGEIKQTLEDYSAYKHVCELIKQEHKFSNWKQVNEFIEGETDYKSLTAKYS